MCITLTKQEDKQQMQGSRISSFQDKGHQFCVFKFPGENSSAFISLKSKSYRLPLQNFTRMNREGKDLQFAFSCPCDRGTAGLYRDTFAPPLWQCQFRKYSYYFWCLDLFSHSGLRYIIIKHLWQQMESVLFMLHLLLFLLMVGPRPE